MIDRTDIPEGVFANWLEELSARVHWENENIQWGRAYRPDR
jgi:hypothetical protein